MLFVVLYICLSVWMSVVVLTNRLPDDTPNLTTLLWFLYYFVMWPISVGWCFIMTMKIRYFSK